MDGDATKSLLPLKRLIGRMQIKAARVSSKAEMVLLECVQRRSICAANFKQVWKEMS